MKIAQLHRGSLKRVLGVSDLFAIGYGDLGSSIYYALGITALFALGATPIALALAGLVFICTALTYAEMTALFHESGGSASFSRHAFNDLISFIAGWGLLLDYIVTIAISAFAVGPYLSYFIPELKQVSIQIGFTVGLIGVLFLLNLWGAKQSTRMSFVLVGFTLVTQLVIIFIGAGWLFNLSEIIDQFRYNAPSWPDFWKGLAMAMVAYTGIESIAQLAAESKKPTRNVPRAIVIAMFVLVFMYLGLSVVALSAMSPHILSTTYLQDPVAGIVAALPFGGKILGPWLGLLAAILLFVAANAGVMGASRLAFNMGEYYQLPKVFYRLLPKRRTPYIALFVFCLFAVLVVIASRGKLEFLADLYNFGAMLAFFSAHLSLIVMRIKKPDLKRPFRVPFNLRFGKIHIPVSALIGLVATAGVWVLVVVTKPQGRILGIGWMIFGLIMYFLYRRQQRIAAAGTLDIEKIKVPHFKPMSIKQILVSTRDLGKGEAFQMACELAKVHKAKVTAIHVLEVPYSLPLDGNMPQRTALAEAELKRAEAVARELNVHIEVQLVRARMLSRAILDELLDKRYDVVVFGKLTAESQKVLNNSPCPVWICS